MPSNSCVTDNSSFLKEEDPIKTAKDKVNNERHLKDALTGDDAHANIDEQEVKGWQPEGSKLNNKTESYDLHTGSANNVSEDKYISMEFTPSLASTKSWHKGVQPLTSSFLKPNASFIGSQQSGRSTYEVKVDLKQVDLKKSTLTGFLTIKGLTESHPEIITLFQGEIVGPKFSFFTNKDSWGSDSRTDIQHWSRFPSFRSLNFNSGNDVLNSHIYDNYLNNEFIYMRWKEMFLIPDAKVRDIKGASFAGFYYVCFSQLTGSISGLYFHKYSEKFQQLELCHAPDGGCSSYFKLA
ncbi:Vacuolar import and degradation protein 24 [Komagataella phaffii CBS 7435]|uniref:Peripheral membrane protein located at Vid (Vacuole import and degradation) vesicles n=2 Tax=Komagataella phaffii TaxID=460519 RepID=C4R6Q0_KOMPG|nr:Peripheral membrane protein located at Vid (vacuole import and degradation) vesicles [Komagataella phaffii GS115]AOA64743.1 GQ67_04356T0 [Komagataella phaffii]CAH2451383.1 Vacuolar import and degradation protein 24 [Komagataella phaffii CBS 7435]AOA70160.1 GQ68_04328T0 [Komagataella phaffii GS115]CAY71275.1 Peripheral membrane protein located at Vid (vacuole import and degradation) vesicles [Komagataella phaffii GS115]CCA41118.1 Vacuolar import and degradation protein 24 [Komagataella phaff